MQKNSRSTPTIYDHIWKSIAGVVALIFVLGGTAITIYVDKSITTQIEARENAYLASVDTMLTHQISSAQQTLDMLLTNPFIVQSIYTGNPDWNSAAYQSGQTIVNAVSSNQTFNSIYVISGDSIAIKSSRRYQSGAIESTLIEAMRTNFRKTLVPWRSEVGSRVNHNLMLLSALDTVSTPNAIGGVLINLDLDRLAAMAFVNYGSSDVFLVMDDQIIASTVPELFFTPVADHPQLAQAIQSQRHLCEGNYIFSLHNPTYGYTVYSIQDRAMLMTPVKTGLAMLLMAISVMLIVSLLFSRHAALHAYTPVKTILVQLEEQLPAGNESSPKELNELQRVSRSIRRTSEIVSAYRRDADTARISKFIHNDTADHYTAELLEKHLGYNGNQTLYMLFFRSDRMEDARMAADVMQVSLDGYARFLTLDMPGQRMLSLACVTAPTDPDDDTVLCSAQQVLQMLTDQGTGKVIMSLHKVTGGMQDLPAAYLKMVERLRSGVFCAHSTLLTDPLSAEIPAELTQQIFRAAQALDAAGYQLATTAYLEACKQLAAHEAYHQLATLCMRIAEAGFNRNQDIADRLDSYRTYFNDLLTLQDYQALTAYMQNLYHTVAEHIQLKKSGESNPLADHILAYMADHFMDPALSASQVADALGISVSHLSRVMSRSVGCGFPEQLQKLRLEKAVALLQEDNCASIAHLAQQCGFGSASYFTASFKRVYGMTPSSYRLKHAGTAKDS